MRSQIRDHRYHDAIRILQQEQQRTSNNRALLSLLGYCFYYIREFASAGECYEKLAQLYTSHVDYKLYCAQSYYSASLYNKANLMLSQIEEPEYATQYIKLQSSINYCEGDISAARNLIEQYPSGDLDAEINLACIDYQGENFTEALTRFHVASKAYGYQPDLVYSIALCHYQLHEYSHAINFIANIVDRGVKDHPELSVGLITEGVDVRPVENTLLLHKTRLIEACNLKCAIEYKLKNLPAALEALTDMPPRSEEELDSVTLHNQALVNADNNPSDSFLKLQYLLNQKLFPPETLSNLLLLYCKYEYFDFGADVLAEYSHITKKFLTQYQYDYFEAVMVQQTSPLDAYNKFNDLANNQINELRKLSEKIKEIRQTSDEQAVRTAIDSYDDTMAKYLPALMSQARIYWELGNYAKIEQMFRNSAEYCSEHDVWKLNVAHTLFMQQNKYKEAAAFYEPIVKKNFDNMLNISAVVLANLCVCYIMTNQNEEAEELMKKVEFDEEVQQSKENKISLHLSIINLVIGTLYCSKRNYEFGISRVIRMMESCEQKLCADTWYYCKRCICSAIESLSKQLIIIRDSVIDDCLEFLRQCEIQGTHIMAVNDQSLADPGLDSAKHTVSYEARLLRALLLEVAGI